MNKEEILEKSRAENKNKDFYEEEILKQYNNYVIIVLLSMAALFTVVQIFTGGGINYGFYALVFVGNMTTSWVKYVKMKRRKELFLAIPSTILVLMFSAVHIYNLITSSTIL